MLRLVSVTDNSVSLFVQCVSADNATFVLVVALARRTGRKHDNWVILESIVISR